MIPPHKPGEAAEDADEEILTAAREVMLYTGLDLYGALALPCDLFLLCRKNYLIEQLNATPEGREYLEECRIANQSEPDWDAVRKLMEIL